MNDIVDLEVVAAHTEHTAVPLYTESEWFKQRGSLNPEVCGCKNRRPWYRVKDTGAMGSQRRTGGWAEPGRFWGDVRLELSLGGRVQGNREKQGVLSRTSRAETVWTRNWVSLKPQGQGEDGNR